MVIVKILTQGNFLPIKIRKSFNANLKFDDFPIGFFGMSGGIE
jgi:hypothetical protein